MMLKAAVLNLVSSVWYFSAVAAAFFLRVSAATYTLRISGQITM